jgi:hypothetical protein
MEITKEQIQKFSKRLAGLILGEEYASKAQARFMHAVHPGIAKRWDAKYGGYKNKPEYVSKKKKRK